MLVYEKNIKNIEVSNLKQYPPLFYVADFPNLLQKQTKQISKNNSIFS